MQIMEASLAAVFSLVTQRCVMRGVTRLKRAVRETTIMADNTKDTLNLYPNKKRGTPKSRTK